MTCCCVADEAGHVVEPCGAHAQWNREQVERDRKGLETQVAAAEERYAKLFWWVVKQLAPKDLL